MIYKMRFTTIGSIGAVLFIGSVAISGWLYIEMMTAFSRGRLPSGLMSNPMVYLGLTIAFALGFVLMIVGREYVPADIFEKERDAAARMSEEMRSRK